MYEDWEWHPSLLGLRSGSERRHFAALRDAGRAAGRRPGCRSTGLAELVAADDGPSLSSHGQAARDLDQFREFVAHRSVYHLRRRTRTAGRSPGSAVRRRPRWWRSRPTSTATAAPDRMHAELFAGAPSTGWAWTPTYGAHVDEAPGGDVGDHQPDVAVRAAPTLAWRALGHLAAFEMTSSLPNRRYGNGLRRLGFDELATRFYDEHVEADAVHEQIAAHDMCGGARRRGAGPRPTCSSARRRRSRWTGCSPRTCWTAGPPAAPRCGDAARWPPDGAVAAQASGPPRRAQNLRRGARPARRAGRGEPGPLVRAVAEGLDAGLPAPAQRDGVPARVDLGTVRVDEPEVPADDQRSVPVGRDGGAGSGERRAVGVFGQVRFGQ